MPPDVRAAFIGLGVQGAPLAQNLLDAGIALAVADALPGRADSLAARGATPAATARDAARRADVVFVCVANDEQLLAATLSDDGALSSMSAGSVLVINSTVCPGTVLEIGGRAGDRGVSVVDAPLTGGAAGAEARSVLYFVGGHDEAVARCEALLLVSARKIVRCGDLGAGSRAKLVHQLLLCGNLVIAHEAWTLAKAAGLAPEVIAQVVRDGAGQSRVAERYPELSVNAHSISLWLKDLGLCRDLAQELGLPLHGSEWVAGLVETLGPDSSHSNGHPT